jgi:uncharacterized protein YdeI (YjbR/CyaY-like superfamily)
MDLTEQEKQQISAWIDELHRLAEEVLAEFNRVERISKPIKTKLRRCLQLVNNIMELVKIELPL